MLISSKHEELTNSIEFILRNPHLYGIYVDSDNMLSIIEVFESLLTFQEWFWINRYDIETVLENSKNFQVVEDRVKLLEINEVLQLRVEIKPHLSEIFFLPLPLSTNKNFKLYVDLRVAVLISGHRIEDFEQASIKQFSRAELETNGVIIENLGTGIFTTHNIESNLGIFVSEEKINSLLSEFYIELMLYELLYIQDEGHQSNACRYLYNQLPQIEVEAKLLKYLNHPDPDVRGNVYLGFSFPVYSAKVYLEQPMPFWESLTEPFTLSSHTVCQILRMIKQEKNLYVLDNAIGTLKAQNYTGKLLGITKDVEKTLTKVLPYLKDKRTINECQRVLNRLFFINWTKNYLMDKKSSEMQINNLSLITFNNCQAS